MRSADSVLETLRRGSPEETFRDSKIRLESAIRSGQGHIVVLGDSQHEAAMFVDSIVARASGYDVQQVSIRRIDETLADALDRPALVLVHDADCASASDLERLRAAAEPSGRAAHHVRLLLVGAAKLELSLALAEARAFNSRVGTHIRLVRKSLAQKKHAVPLIRRAAPRRWALVSSAVTGCAALACLAVADLSQPSAAESLLAKTAGELVKLGEGMSAVLAGAGIPTSRGSSLVASAGDSVLSILEPVAPSAVRAISAASPTPSLASPGRAPTSRNAVAKSPRPTIRAGKPTVAAPVAKSTSRAAVRASKPTTQAAKPAAPVDSGLVAYITRLLVGEPVSTVQAASHAPSVTPIRRPKMAEVGSFSRPQGAFALKSDLEKHFDVLAVARFDPPTGPVFAVRVFDPKSRQTHIVTSSTQPTE